MSAVCKILASLSEGKRSAVAVVNDSPVDCQSRDRAARRRWIRRRRRQRECPILRTTLPPTSRSLGHLACGRAGRGSDSPPDCHSLPRLRFAYPHRGRQGFDALTLAQDDRYGR